MFKIGLIFFPLFFLSCSSVVKDCYCTDEFRMYTVTVLDLNGNRVGDLQTRVQNTVTGRIYKFETSLYFEEGIYPVMDDTFTQEFTTQPEEIIFSGTKDDKSVEGSYLFNSDECNCHVNKITGPDTLILN
jgi:hypothetical protein